MIAFCAAGYAMWSPPVTLERAVSAPGQGLAFRCREEPGGRGLAVRDLFRVPGRFSFSSRRSIQGWGAREEPLLHWPLPAEVC